MTHNPECGLDCVSAGAVRGQPADADLQTGRQHLAGDQSVEYAKHTPGPWAANDNADVVTDDGVIAWCSSPDSFEDGDEPAMANARLIAAAPDLLDALKSLMGFADEGATYSSRTEKARNAIAKAEGRDR